MSESDDRPLPLRVRLPFTSEEEFIRRFGANLSPTGIFIPTKSLKPEGTRLRFELVLTDGARLLRGEVQVARARAEAPGVRPGMELAFTELDAPSLAFLERALDELQRPPEPRPPRSPVPVVSVGSLLSSSTVSLPAEQGRVPARSEPVRHVHGDGASRDAPREEPAPAGAERNLLPAADLEREPQTEQTARRERLEELERAALAEQARQERQEVLERAALAQQALRQERQEEFERAALAQQAARAEQQEELERAALAQRTARAERVEDLARASVQGADALTARARRPELERILGLAVDRPELPAARLSAGILEWCAAPPPRSRHGRRLLARSAGSARVLEYASEVGLEIAADAGGFASWREDAAWSVGADWAREQLGVWAGQDPDPTAADRLHVVLAVPLHAGHLQRSAWAAAARHAGFVRSHLISAPVAAALAHVHGRGLARRRLLVLDSSGSGFDAAVVQVTGDDLETLSAAGDAFLGEPEIAARLSYEVRQGMREAGLLPPEPSSPEGRTLLSLCQEVREGLAGEESIELETRSLARTPAGEPADFPFTVTRARLDELTADLIERKCGLVREVLAAASLTSSGVDEVLFLGAIQRSPLLLQRLAQLLERPLGPEMEGSPRLVAHGAALWGAALSRAAQERVPFSVSEVLAIPLSIAERGGTLRRILDRGTRLPASKTLQLPVTDARGLGILVHQGSGTSAEEADALGALLARPTLPGDVELHFDLSAEGTVRIEVQVPGLPTQDLVPLALDPEQRAQLQVQAPEGTQPAPEGRGLIGGLRRLFQKR